MTPETQYRRLQLRETTQVKDCFLSANGKYIPISDHLIEMEITFSDKDFYFRPINTDGTDKYDSSGNLTQTDVRRVPCDPVNYISVSPDEYDRLMQAEARLKEAVDLLTEARLQIQYLHEKFQQTGSGNAVISKIETFLTKIQ